MTTKSFDTLSLIFSALADPTRRQILSRLGKSELTVMQVAKPFKMTQPAVSKHLKVLERAGLIVRGREAQWRPAKLQAAPLRDAAVWVHEFRQHWDKNFDSLDAYLKTMPEEEENSTD